MNKRLILAPLMAVALAAAGCGGPAVGNVAGRVVLNGAPVTGGQISFIPPDGRAVAADISPDGTYRVEGVTPGKAIILVIAPVADEGAAMTRLKESAAKGGRTAPAPPPAPRLDIPSKYGDVATSGLTFVVEAGENAHTVELQK